ncbi:hypothetical protein MWU59_01000 [Flavobacteriaceae bacterium F08102]|nr:hypothetical protein [Flavobacteriaceae bacterium F08102]
MYRFTFIIITLCLYLQFSCSQKQENASDKTNQLTEEIDSLKQQHIRNLSELLSPESRELVASWKSYQQLDQLIDKFYTYSVQEVLYSSSELANATQLLKDSISINRLKEIDVLTRLDVLNNSALRLKDMASITSISAEEVNQETQEMLNAFGALNSKINNITQQEKLELEVKDIESRIDKLP